MPLGDGTGDLMRISAAGTITRQFATTREYGDMESDGYFYRVYVRSLHAPG
jgi:hypothetical protein